MRRGRVQASGGLEVFMAFQFAHAGGSDWRRVTRICVDQLERAPSGDALGLIYVSGECAAFADALIAAFEERTGVDRWIGMAADAVIGGALAHDKPAAAAAMIVEAAPGALRYAAGPSDVAAGDGRSGGVWLTHASGGALETLAATADEARRDGAVALGAVAGPEAAPALIGSASASDGAQLCAFDPTAIAAHGVAAGCAPLGPVREVTAAFGACIAELDGEPAILALERALGDLVRRDVERARGFAHIAEPTRQGGWRIRAIEAIDAQRGRLMVGGGAAPRRLAFARRDGEAATDEVERLARAVERAGDAARPRGAVYFASSERLSPLYAPGVGELRRLRTALGGAPLIGAYAGGAVHDGRPHALAGVMLVFR